MSSNARGPLIVISGPSGVGKSTLVERLLRSERLNLRRAVTATSRGPRPGETDGVHYHFWTPERFQTAIAAGEMLEHAIVHGRDYYGTPRSEVDPHREAGSGVLLVIDVQGAEQIRRLYPGDHYSIFLSVTDFAALRQRLRDRGEPEASIERRILTAQAELPRAPEYDCLLANDDLETATRELARIIRRQFACGAACN